LSWVGFRRRQRQKKALVREHQKLMFLRRKKNGRGAALAERGAIRSSERKVEKGIPLKGGEKPHFGGERESKC